MNWSREEFRKYIAGHFALMVGTDKDSLSKYVEGGVFAFDQLVSKKVIADQKDQKEVQAQDESKLN